MPRGIHVKYRNGIYYWRHKIPIPLASRFRLKELSFSLRTSDPRVATVRARRLSVLCDDLFNVAKSNPQLSVDQLKALARDWFRQHQDADELEHVVDEITEEAARSGIAIEHGAASHAADELHANDFSGIAQVVAGFLDAGGLHIAKEAPEFRLLCHYFLRAYRELARLRIERLKGIYHAEPRDPLFQTTRTGEPVAPSTNREFRHGDSPMLSELIGAYLEASTWTAQTLDQNRRTLKAFLEHLGDRPVSAIKRKDVASFLDALSRSRATREPSAHPPKISRSGPVWAPGWDRGTRHRRSDHSAGSLWPADRHGGVSTRRWSGHPRFLRPPHAHH